MNNSENNKAVDVKVINLRKKFDNQEVLKGISFEVNPGEIFVIIGPSGSGKSVLLKHIIGLEKPDEGDILINGESILKSNVFEKYRIAMVFQSSALLNSLTVGENVGLYLSEHRLKSPEEIKRIVAEKLEIVGLKGTEDKMPSELSGGMKKRVAIARALVIEPQLILYDEPTSELDPLIAVTIAEEILNLRRRIGATSIVVTHDRDLAFAIADRIAMLYEGKIIFDGTPDKLRECENPIVKRFISVELNINNNNKVSERI
jgi:phospholipid/cholesterol/gamma-HCH transport system ATP-binding protein